jgi:hypothetical protein
MAPDEATQFGEALQGILQAIVDANLVHRPVHLLKVDIADGFYRIWFNLHDILKLAVSLPQLQGEELLLALPLVLPMGWTKSPPYFCAATETVANITNKRLANYWQMPPHQLEDGLYATNGVLQHAHTGHACQPHPRNNRCQITSERVNLATIFV